MTRLTQTLCALALLALLCAGVADARIPAQWKNCTTVNARYHHGVGKAGARDHTSGTPVTNFKRSNALYATANSFNKGLDRDKDGIACEKA
jgi:hypothetical protein